jgi:hypothetical protein
MSIQFEHVEGVVQQEGEPSATPQAAAPTDPVHEPPAAEQFRSHHQRLEWLTLRLSAD